MTDILRIIPAQRFDYIAPVNPNGSINPPTRPVTWLNTSTGEIFICVDNSIEDNLWLGQRGSYANKYLAMEDFTALGTTSMTGRKTRVGGFRYSEAGAGMKTLNGLLVSNTVDVSGVVSFDDGVSDFVMTSEIPSLAGAGANRWAYIGFRQSGSTQLAVEIQTVQNTIRVYSFSPAATVLWQKASSGISLAGSYPLRVVITADGSRVVGRISSPAAILGEFDLTVTFNQSSTGKYLQNAGLCGFSFVGTEIIN